jgi:thiamine biosynthesis lipoprotein
VDTPAVELIRESRPAMGTAVGITARATPADLDAAFASVERFEAELSEWRPTSATARMVTEGPQRVSPEGRALFSFAAELRSATDGAFDIGWRGATLGIAGDVVSASGPVDLGAVLKGFLADRAADTLRERGVADFIVDAAGDIVAGGSDGSGDGWPVTALTAAGSWTVRLHDEALSTSAGDRQPGHIKDARTGAPVDCLRAVVMTAPTGLQADGWATAFTAACGQVKLPDGLTARWVGRRGWRHQRAG